jgi:hypothetical protein
MTVVTVAQVKTFLRVINTSDDALLLDHIAASEAEALMYMDRRDLPRVGEDEPPDECDTAIVIDIISEGTSLAPDVRQAIYYLVQSKYEARDADDVMKLRGAAFALLAPHRHRMGA